MFHLYLTISTCCKDKTPLSVSKSSLHLVYVRDTPNLRLMGSNSAVLPLCTSFASADTLSMSV